MSSEPPRSDTALPIDDTVMSIGWPGLANGGSSAWMASGHVLQLRVDVGRHVHAQLAQQVLQALHGEGCLAGAVAAAVQADHQAIAHQRIGAHAAHLGQVLDAFGRRRGNHREHGQQRQHRAHRVERRRASLLCRVERRHTSLPEQGKGKGHVRLRTASTPS